MQAGCAIIGSMDTLSIISALGTVVALACAAGGATGALGEPRDVTFKAQVDGSEQRYVEMLPVGFGPDEQHDVLIALHGCGADRWQYVRDARDECRAARDIAAKRAMIFISPDYRAPGSWMGPKAEADVLQIIRELRRKYKVGRVFLVGASMGGASVLTFAALHPELIAGVSSLNGTANYLLYDGFQEYIVASFGGTREQIPAEYKKRSAEYWPEKFTMPLAITTGGKDTIVPPDSAVRLAEAVRRNGGRVLLINRPEVGHCTTYEDSMTALEWVIGCTLNGKQPAV